MSPQSQRWLIVVAGSTIGIVSLLLLILWNRSSPKIDDSSAHGVADQFLEEIRQGKPDQAWARTTADFKSFRGRDAFRAFVKSKPVLKTSLAFDSVSKEPLDNRELTVCHYAIPGKTGHVLISVAYEGNEWKVDSIKLE